MTNARRNALLAGAALVAGAGGYVLNLALRPASQPAELDPELALRSLHKLTLPDLQGRPQRLDQWAGKILVANFWATWCEPCREEIPLLISFQSKYENKNLQIVGISVDSVDKIVDFSKKYTISYPLLVAGFESVELMRSLGNKAGGLPFSVVLNPQGRIVGTHLGAFKEGQLRKLLHGILI